MEATKIICCVKDEGAVDPCTITRLFKKYGSGCTDLDNQARSGRSKTVVSEAIVANLVSSTWRVSGKHSITQSSDVHHVHDISKHIQICWITSYITKILQNFWLTLELCWSSFEHTIIILIPFGRSLFIVIGLVWFIGFYGISTFVGYLMPNPFLCK